MFSWMKGDEQARKNADVYDSVTNGLQQVYKQKLLPLEKEYQFHDFHSPALDDPDFDARPMVMLVGQYSTGKTTFIRYLLEQDFPGIRIGPEPTTDRFIAVMHADQDGVVPGNALVVDPKKQFRPLSKFGNAFLNRFQCSNTKSEVLKGISIVDTPGILSGEKQRVDRGYDFVGVLRWFAERVDRILLLFDANKLDISDEFRRSIEAIHGYEDKVRIVLNKADQVDHQELMRVYGALMWSISKVINVPECPKIFVGSFWDQQLKHDLYRRLFEKELQCLFEDLPRYAAMRKLNDFIKRARMAKIHAYIISNLREDMPKLFGKGRKKKELIKNLPTLLKKIQEENMVSTADMPELNEMQEKLAQADFQKFPPLKEKLIAQVNHMLDKDIADLMAIVPTDYSEPVIRGGAFDDVKDMTSPFGFEKCEGIDLGSGEPEWIVSKERTKWDDIFHSLGPVKGKITGSVAKKEMVKSRLPNPVLAKVWRLADVDQDGMLDADEFALSMHLINIKLDGFDLPDDLPSHLVPPSKKKLFNGQGGSSGSGSDRDSY